VTATPTYQRTQPVATKEVLEDAITWSYRLILGREPENNAVVQAHAQSLASIPAVRHVFQRAYKSSLFITADSSRVPDEEIISLFLPAWTGPGEPGYWYDFLGVRTRCDYLPPSYSVLSGTVEGTPGTERAPIHDVAEWMGTLRSVVEARSRGRLVVVELGAGWGPWLVGAARAARHLGIHEVKLVGVEGSESHVAFMLQHFQDNGLDPGAHLIIRGVVGAQDGIARFPKLPDPSADWGAVANFDRTSGANEFEEVRCVALSTLLKQLPIVDLIHCDVQGAELEVFMGNETILTSSVRRVIVGTHSRRIEAELLDFFSNAGWRLEEEEVCRLLQHAGPGPLGSTRDGYQVWRNPQI
jgi:FkbM family methyltransferase